VRFWWVNQNQTFEQEFRGGYLWSPKRNRNGARNRFYENMREVAPGDVIFSFRKQVIAAIGFALSYGYECPKPTEFGTIGPNWGAVGWRVDVRYTPVHKRVLPKRAHGHARATARRALRTLQVTGEGLQSVYLTEISRDFAGALAGLIGPEIQLDSQPAEPVESTTHLLPARGIDEWEDQFQRAVLDDGGLTETARTALIKARRGQGIFKQNVMRVETACRVTRVDNPVHLIGSHIKPWRDSDNDERLDGANGLLLTPSIDHLFDRGFISFRDNGDLLISPVADRASLERMGVRTDGVNVGSFGHKQMRYLEFHRDAVFLQVSGGTAE
jgi:putative restriction endonuclease